MHRAIGRDRAADSTLREFNDSKNSLESVRRFATSIPMPFYELEENLDVFLWHQAA